ncbi:MAG: hypothetical protein KGN76_07150, partial [Acidobacteriota bacterium]|nr:hypothetical protein [Acidobacteriota bacterium]
GEVGGLRGEVGGLRGEVDGLRGEVGALREEVGGLREEVGGLRGEVGDLRGEVGGLREEVGALRGLPDEVGRLRRDVETIRVLDEARDEKIRLIAEVQAHHGKQLEHITKELEPLREIRDFIHTVAGDHERRITALERRTTSS